VHGGRQAADLQIADCRFADCRVQSYLTLPYAGRLQICRLQISYTPNHCGGRQAADLQILQADSSYPSVRRMGPWSIIGGPGPQAPWDQIINTSFGPWVQAHWDPRTGVISINTSFGPWAQSGALGPSDRGYLFFIFIFGSQIG